MQIKARWIMLLVVTAGTVLMFQNCSEPLPDQAQVSQSSTSPQSEDTRALTLAADQSTVNGGDSLQLTASGGSSPYTYSVITGSGSVSSTGLFTAPAVQETNVVQVKDAKGATAQVVLEVKVLLTITYSSPVTTEKIKLQTTGGTAPYTYSLLSGSGTVSGDELTPGSASNATSLIAVRDALGNTNQISITVMAPASVTLYRLVDSSNSVFYSTDLKTGPLGYTDSGISYRLFASQGTNMVAVRKCMVGTIAGSAFYTSLANCPIVFNTFSRDLGVVGYLSTVARPNTVAIYGNSSFPTLMSVRSADLNAVGVVPKVIGYVIP